ncbi:MAG: hypothetical protein VYC17_00550 [Nitrospinota bacterium]|nr:hypothetical protein [Nitrospinota bacterium]
MSGSLRSTGFILMVLYLAVAACAAMKNGEAGKPFPEEDGNGNLSAVAEPQSVAGFPDLPIPRKFKFNRGKSFFYEAGSGTIKVGHLFFSGRANLEKVIPFYQNEMVNKGWKLVQFVERDISTLHYEKENLSCRVTLASSLGKTEIEIVIGPK